MAPVPIAIHACLVITPPPSQCNALHDVYPDPVSPQLVDINTQSTELHPGLLDLRLQLVVRCGAFVEGDEAPAEAGEEVGAEGNESPDGELVNRWSLAGILGRGMEGGRRARRSLRWGGPPSAQSQSAWG